MRILHVISTMAPSSGGPTAVMAGLLPAQVHDGLDVVLCTTDRDNPSSKRLDAASVHGRLAPAIATHVFPAEMPSLLISRALRAWLRRNIDHFDLVHAHGLYRFPSTYAVRLARRCGVPSVICPHGSLDPFLYRQSARSVLLKRLWERWFDLPNLHGASAIHYTTEDERQRAAFLKLRAPSFVVPIGLDWSRYAGLPARGAFRAKLGIGDSPLVLFLSRLNFKKGLDLLVPAFAQVRARFPDAVLALVGPDNEGYGAKVRGWVMEHGLQDAVRFVDYIEGEQVLQAYVDADVFALPSYTENFGMVVAESLACGTPVVISDQVNIHGEVSGAGAGLITRCDAGEVAEALCTLLGDAPRRRVMGAAGRALVQRQWTWDVVASQLTAEYETIIARHRDARSTRGT
ncbi:MAG: glycosyltransferase [Alphaproteobacteria bacterium]|nr:glycosyltransferase [Alphaproteobacteria bacterium]